MTVRETNELVAEKVMGWEPASGGYYFIDRTPMASGLPMRMVCMESGDGAAPHWSPATSWETAAEVLEKFHHWVLAATKDGGARCTVVVHDEAYRSITARASTVPMAVCSAALKALGGE